MAVRWRVLEAQEAPARQPEPLDWTLPAPPPPPPPPLRRTAYENSSWRCAPVMYADCWIVLRRTRTRGSVLQRRTLLVVIKTPIQQTIYCAHFNKLRSRGENARSWFFMLKTVNVYDCAKRRPMSRYKHTYAYGAYALNIMISTRYWQIFNKHSVSPSKTCPIALPGSLTLF